MLEAASWRTEQATKRTPSLSLEHALLAQQICIYLTFCVLQKEMLFRIVARRQRERWQRERLQPAGSSSSSGSIGKGQEQQQVPLVPPAPLAAGAGVQEAATAPPPGPHAQQQWHKWQQDGQRQLPPCSTTAASAFPPLCPERGSGPSGAFPPGQQQPSWGPSPSAPQPSTGILVGQEAPVAAGQGTRILPLQAACGHQGAARRPGSPLVLGWEGLDAPGVFECLMSADILEDFL
jgi:hypothetical protein